VSVTAPLQSVVDALPEAAMVVDSTGVVLVSNAAAAALLELGAGAPWAERDLTPPRGLRDSFSCGLWLSRCARRLTARRRSSMSQA